jgi:hypothetical protein
MHFDHNEFLKIADKAFFCERDRNAFQLRDSRQCPFGLRELNSDTI